MSRLMLSLCVVLSVCATRAWADFSAARCRGPTTGTVRVVEAHGRCAGFTTSRDGGRDTVTFALPMSGVLVASADGRSVVMLESYLEGSVEKGRVQAFRSGPIDAGVVVGVGEENPIVIRVFRDGREIGAQHIHDALGPRAQFRESISHVSWLRTEPTALPANGPLALALLDGTTLSVDLTTGKVALVYPADDHQRGRN